MGLVEVPDHPPLIAAAIAHAAAQTAVERDDGKHPYHAATTPVPAVAAQAHHDWAGRRSVEVARRAIETAPPCTHYQRGCHIVSPCCGATFGCRICHDECPVLPPRLEPAAAGTGDPGGSPMGGGGRRRASLPTGFASTMGPPEHHTIDRFAIKEIICNECFTKQSSKTNFCVNCNVQFGEYHCAICNLWMSNEERPYHCPDCGFCRVGGGENFRHCLDCGMCIDKALFADHNCKVGKYMSNCPVCQEDLFSSREASHELPCGHAIHWHCFQELAGHDSRCPICKKTAETHERMKPAWDAMAMSIAMQPVPPELCKVVTIRCNDCETVQTGRGWHFLGVQCRDCESFNTVVESIELMGPEAHRFLLRNNDGGGELVRRVLPLQGAEARSIGTDAAASPVIATGGNGRGQGSPNARDQASPSARRRQRSQSARRRRRASMAVVPSSRPPPPPGIDPPPFR